MAGSREKVVVAMSGGVDSSVAACLLVEQGYEVMGFFMRVGGHENSETYSLPSEKKEPPFDPPLVRGEARSAARNETAKSPGQPARAHQGCCSAVDASDARFVAGMLGIPFYALNFEREFDGIIDYFVDEYARGRTPNPCVVCNDRLKFGKLLEYADAVGAKYIATGHYARVQRNKLSIEDCRLKIGEALANVNMSTRQNVNITSTIPKADCRLPIEVHENFSPPAQGLGHPHPRLMRGVDRAKDQSYVLFGLRREVLERVMFPIGGMTKAQVRQIARERGLPNCDKPDSVEICFVPDRNYARLVRERRPESFVGGEVVDSRGDVIGHHDGLPSYTVGQRRGLRIAAGKPIYVKQLDVLNNRVVTGESDELLCDGLLAERLNLVVDDLGDEFRADVKIRYLHTATPATVQLLGGSRARVMFNQPQRAVTPGQAVVFYDGDVVIGGGWIAEGFEPSSRGSAGAVVVGTIQAER
ncbi:MAG: tRNA-specific 2-thiouridylase [Planctomycetes bacterium]|nr:tRNA-specific 2-thiouridylase [Planctomycetota bacterium]MBI3834550.1 tRNA-specific 2-thiouridylase [Planctomycetota bacterium]